MYVVFKAIIIHIVYYNTVIVRTPHPCSSSCIISVLYCIVIQYYSREYIDIINHSTYYNDDDFRNVLKNTKSELSILNLNCLNLNTRFYLLKLLLVNVDINSHIDCNRLQGTCFNENTDITFYVL